MYDKNSLQDPPGCDGYPEKINFEVRCTGFGVVSDRRVDESSGRINSGERIARSSLDTEPRGDGYLEMINFEGRCAGFGVVSDRRDKGIGVSVRGRPVLRSGAMSSVAKRATSTRSTPRGSAAGEVAELQVGVRRYHVRSTLLKQGSEAG